MFLNKIRVFLLINLHIVILLTSPENLKAKELKIITGIAKVIDGDTILINKKKIRLFGIDAPERDQKCQKIWLTISFFSFNKDYFCIPHFKVISDSTYGPFLIVKIFNIYFCFFTYDFPFPTPWSERANWSY